MQIIVKDVWKEAIQYIEATLENGKYEENWESYMIEPFWKDLCCYAPFDLSERKPRAIKDVETLKKQIALLEEINISELQKEMQRVVELLPNFDDDPITVVLYPMDDQNATVKEKQNGVIGTSLFGNLIIQINPFAKDFMKWIPYVFAHEYHHTVWGNYWFMMHGGELNNQFIDSLVIDGEADSFAMSLYPDLKPSWIFDSLEITEKMWKDIYKELACKTDVDYATYMFGNKEKEIPWCAGYSVGYMLVQKYLNNENKSIIEILKIKPEDIMKNFI